MAGQGPWGGGDDGKGGKQPPQGGGQPPWGSPGGGKDDRPQGPRRGDQIPEIEELVRKGQDRLRVLMGGKGGGGGGRGTGPRRPQGPQFQMSRGTWGVAALAVLALWAFSSFYTVKPEERAVELLFGKPVGTGEPGLNFAPWPFITAEVVQVSGERTTEIGTGRAGPMDSGLMLTRDQNIVDMAYQVVWNISDPEKFLFNLADPDDTIRAVSESAMRDIVARSELAPILNRDRGAIADDLKLAAQNTLNDYEAGINVLRVNLDRADPPREVIDSFREVQAAQQERDRLEKEADAYANRVLASARGEAAAMIERAEAYRAEAVNNAEGEAARFNSVYEEYVKAPEVTRRRMYLETMEKVLGGVNKVILDGEAGQGVVPYLPLDQLRSGSAASGGGSGSASSATTNSGNTSGGNQ
ncbi:protease FtsH subunit HflK [Paracoccus thiocyanatus]|uniref:Protein HflK n=1 Tax=Paracoccus thiocyanatus TaxID=34006 RepID=A0A1N6PYH5_9RHOB|nr:FtsH protease activity modulator HflK [Paracoccus thiocyanatus]SIQ09484.1 protease FtsH subunit HflK [Paracoccus thiocyanatus]